MHLYVAELRCVVYCTLYFHADVFGIIKAPCFALLVLIAIFALSV